jgi:D-tyrosyl-tRNA(Tyr) deacylase
MFVHLASAQRQPRRRAAAQVSRVSVVSEGPSQDFQGAAGISGSGQSSRSLLLRRSHRQSLAAFSRHESSQDLDSSTSPPAGDSAANGQSGRPCL